MRKMTVCTGVLVAAALLLGACSSGGDGGSTPGGDAAAGDGNPDHDPCLLGTWQVDVQDLATQVGALLTTANAQVEGDGTITLEFGTSADITYGNTLTMTFPMSTMSMVGKAVYSGTASVPDWKATGGTFTGGTPSGDFHVALTFNIGGTEVAAPFDMPALGDLGGGVPLSYTCSGDAAALTPPAPAPTWHLTRAA